ncbi:FtsX-like permease family protein [Actinoplanes sp. NPDC051343]|uniref:FtsX-like permease family protein n=1 Tax=Actinoplanes sp. NPDC051343 TaxID=3363906 RepID=UPI0037B71F87
MLSGRARTLAGAFVAAVLGVAAVCMSTLLYASSRPGVPQTYRDAPIVVQSPTASGDFVEPVPWPDTTATTLAARLAGLAGVTAAVPVHQFYAQPVRDGHPVPGATLGFGWAAATLGGFRLTEGAPPSADRDIAVGSGLGAATGAHLTVLTASGPADYLITGVVAHGGYRLWLSDHSARTLAPGVRAIGLRLTPGADVVAVADAARAFVRTRGEVLADAERTTLEAPADARTRWIGLQVLVAVAALSGFVTAFIVAGTYAFSVAQRRREFALLRTLGATPRRLRRALYLEALTVGAIASVTGTVLGTVVAPALAGPLVRAGAEPVGYTVRPHWWPIAASLAIGPLLATAGAATASWRASRVPPLDALREASVEERPMGRVRWIAGLLFATVGLGLVVLMATAGSVQSLGNLMLLAAMALITAAALLAPAVVPPLARMLGAVLARGSGAIGLLVREGAATAPRRTASVAAPVLLTLAFSVLVSGLFATTTASYAARRAAAVEAGSVLAPDGTPGLSDAAVAPLQGTGSAVLLPSVAYTDDRQALQLMGADPAALAAADNRARALIALHSPDTAAVSQAAATRLTLAEGSTLRLTFADGTTTPLRIALVLPDNVVPADLLVDRATLRSHDPGALTSAVLLPDPHRPDSAFGAPTSPVPPLGPVRFEPGPGARVISVATWAGEQDAQENRVAWVLVVLLMGVSAGYGALALVNTLLMAAGARAADFRLLRRAGATPRQVGQAAAGEAVLVVAVGALLAGAIAVPALLGIRAGLSEQMGAHVPLVVPWATIAAILGVTLILAVGAAALPARRSLRST